MANILDSLKGYVTSELISKVAGSLGENESGVSKAIGGLLPTILSGMAGKAGDSNAMSGLFNMLSDKGNAGFLDNLGGLVGGGNLAHGDPKDIAGRLMSTLFGSKVGGIIDMITSFAGVKRSSTSGLLGMVGPLIMGYLGKRIMGEGLNAGGLAKLLLGERKSFAAALPSGMGNLLGIGDIKDEVEEVASSGTKWLWPLLIGALAIGGIWYFMKGCNKEVKVDVPAAVDTVQANVNAAVDTTKAAVTEAVGALGNFFKKKLACGVELSIPEKGVEARVVAYIEDPNMKVHSGKDIVPADWHDFDRLTFETGKSTLDMAKSEEQLKNIAEILKCYPKVKFKIGGYTDSDGDDKANMKLSQERADNVCKALVTLGAGTGRIKGEGYGEEHPVAANDTEENKAKNRRIALRVMEK